MIRSNLFILLLVLTGIFCSCKKVKVDTLLQPSGTEVASNSSIRLFNFFNFNLDLTINNIPLTSYSSSQGTQVGLDLFPTGAWQSTDNGNPFFVPNSLVTKDRKVHILISAVPGQLIQGVSFKFTPVDTVLTDDALHPNDFYALTNGHLLVVPRNTQAPVQPDHFKIRVINLGAAVDPNDCSGAVELTYSDGSSIDPRLDNIPGHTAADTMGLTPFISPYVDLPYGAYMFKVFALGDFKRQFPESPILPNLDNCSYPSHAPVTQQGIFPKVRTFKPGASYSIVITAGLGLFPNCSPSLNYPIAVTYNSYRIITEQSPGPNTTYARMDAYNALPVPSVTVTVDGQPLGKSLAYMDHTDYSIYVQGTHQVQAIDAKGTVLVSKPITLSPYDNFTAWVYESPSGHPDICFANTDMTSTLYQTDRDGNVFSGNTSGADVYVPPVDDGTDGTIRVKVTPFAWQSRFLNLTPDVPYATFTNDVSPFPGLTGGTGKGVGDSTNFATASINLQPGLTPDFDPFVIYPFQCSYNYGNPSAGYESYNQVLISPPSVIRAFQSNPGPPAVVPGTLMQNVAPLPREAFISNPDLYPDPRFMPVCEPGIYTTALIGRAGASTSDQDRARLIILKHSK